MKALIGFSLFVSGMISFAMASTAGEPAVYYWMTAAVLILGGGALIAFDTVKKDIN